MNKFLMVAAFGCGVLAGCTEAPLPADTSADTAVESKASPFRSNTQVGNPQCAPEDCLVRGGFTPPFVEPVIFDRNPATPADDTLPLDPTQNPLREVPTDDRCERLADGRAVNCKPTAASVAMLKDGRVLYFNALEGTESVEFSIVSEAGRVVINDQTRVLELRGRNASWTMPSPFDGGADGDTTCLLPGCLGNTDPDEDFSPNAQNNGSLFCSDLEQLPDGRIIAVGGTNYYYEPGVYNPTPIGIVELEGVRNSRVFDPKTNTWGQTGSMNYGRWYPTLVPLSTGDIFVASGVTKLLKPVYSDPDRLAQSGRNVVETETFKLGCGTWTDNGSLAQRSLPLYPRLHLLPNGQVFYNGGGQAFNPFGQAYDQALWNIVGTYDPITTTWTDLGYAGLPLRMNKAGLGALSTVLNSSNPDPAASATATLAGVADSLAQPDELLRLLGSANVTDPMRALDTAIGAGFRGSTFSIMLPLKPDPATGAYNKAEFLVSGGVIGAVTANSPGSYITTNLSRVDTVNIAADGLMSYESRLTGAMNGPRWYGTGVLLPTGEVLAFSGANRDEVVNPGTGTPILQSELFDPVTETWKPMAVQTQPRTYHNTAMLLPDGRVLVGGHSPINTAYAYSINLPGQSPNDGRDPTFEIYSPPYIFKARPELQKTPDEATYGDVISVQTPQAAEIESVVLVRYTTLTHIVDGAQRNVELPIRGRSKDRLSVEIPTSGAVLPPGPYMLFINRRDQSGLVPSQSRPLTITGADYSCTSL